MKKKISANEIHKIQGSFPDFSTPMTNPNYTILSIFILPYFGYILFI